MRMRPIPAFGSGRRCAAPRAGSIAGANVENASYPEGNCAEASALAALVAAGERRISEVLVVAAGERLCTPCGGCRQRLAEFGAPEIAVHLCDPAGLRRTVTLGELLPLSFALEEAGPADAPDEQRDADYDDDLPDVRQNLPVVAGTGAVEVVRARCPHLRAAGRPDPRFRARRPCRRDRATRSRSTTPNYRAFRARASRAMPDGSCSAIWRGAGCLPAGPGPSVRGRAGGRRQRAAAHAQGARLRDVDPDQRRRRAAAGSGARS